MAITIGKAKEIVLAMKQQFVKLVFDPTAIALHSDGAEVDEIDFIVQLFFCYAAHRFTLNAIVNRGKRKTPIDHVLKGAKQIGNTMVLTELPDLAKRLTLRFSELSPSQLREELEQMEAAFCSSCE